MKLGWRSALGFVLSAALLWYTLRDVDFRLVGEALRHANLWLLAASAIAATGIFPLRAIRWRPILHSVVPNLPFGPLWRSTAIGMMVNNVIPARAGELARAFALSRERPDVPFSASFASLAVDRLFDGVVLLALMVLATLDPVFPSGTLISGFTVLRWIGGSATIIGIGVLGIVAIAYFPDRIERLFEVIVGKVAPATEAKGIAFIRSFTAGLGVLRHPGRALVVLWWTVVHWVLNGIAFWIAFKAVGIDLPISAGMFLQGLVAIGVALPAAPGFFGVFEAFGKTGLAVYGIPGSLAVTWAIGYHVLSYIPITAMGTWYFTRLGLSLGELNKAAEAEHR